MGNTDFSDTQKKYLENLLKKHCDTVCSEIRDEVRALKSELESSKNKIKELEEKVSQLDKKLRKKNLILYGLTAENTELEKKVLETLNGKLKVELEERDIGNIHKLGRDKNSPVLIEFNSFKKRKDTLSQTYKLKETGLSISPDYTQVEREERRILVQCMRESRSKGKQAFIKGNILTIDHQRYSAAEILEERNRTEEVDDEKTIRNTRNKRRADK